MRSKIDASLVVDPDKGCGTGRVLVLGLGNILLRDEGIGVHIAHKLQELAIPNNVEVMDGGTACLDVLLLAASADKLVVIDALMTGKKPGTIYKLKLKTEEKMRLTQIFSQQQSKISLHQVGLIDALAAAEKMNCAPSEIVIIGVEPGEVACGLELTEALKRTVPRAIKKVLEEIKDDIHGE